MLGTSMSLRKALESVLGIGLLVTAIFFARMRMSELEPRFLPISAALVMINDEPVMKDAGFGLVSTARIHGRK